MDSMNTRQKPVILKKTNRINPSINNSMERKRGTRLCSMNFLTVEDSLSGVFASASIIKWEFLEPTPPSIGTRVAFSDKDPDVHVDGGILVESSVAIVQWVEQDLGEIIHAAEEYIQYSHGRNAPNS
mmetsp:Transcript_12886/g.27272  ORF Transcript_12886/g.27272 Transcript_12886/m.27272 type:complete len:127 (+) Transcript_12886:944-1324(+)